jgi:hypothetical protein
VLSPRTAAVSAAAAAALFLGVVFALPASALPGDDANCPEKAGKTCTQTPPATCPAGTTLAPVQSGEGTTCVLDSLVRARAKTEVLTHDQLLKLCADVHVRQLAAVRIAVGYPPYEIITLDGRTCGEPVGSKNCEQAAKAGFHDIPSTDPHYTKRLDEDNDGIACETAPDTVVPVVPVIPVVPVVPAPTPSIISTHLPVTH